MDTLTQIKELEEALNNPNAWELSNEQFMGNDPAYKQACKDRGLIEAAAKAHLETLKGKP